MRLLKARPITKCTEEARHAQQKDFDAYPGGPEFVTSGLLQSIDDIDGKCVRSADFAKHPQIPEVTNIAYGFTVGDSDPTQPHGT